MKNYRLPYSTVRQVELRTKLKIDESRLRDFCNARELETFSLAQDEAGFLEAYPAFAWERVYGINLDSFLEAQF